MTFVTSPRAVFQKEEAKQAKEVTDGLISQEMKMTMTIPDDFSNNKRRLFVFKVILTALQPAYSAFFPQLFISHFRLGGILQDSQCETVYKTQEETAHFRVCLWPLSPSQTKCRV